MENSVLKTVVLPIIGTSPAVICRAGAVPLRVLITLAAGGANNSVLAFDPNALFPAITSSSFVVNTGDVFCLAPGQGLYGNSLAVVRSIGAAISELIGT